jgi:hypothetical protein
MLCIGAAVIGFREGLLHLFKPRHDGRCTTGECALGFRHNVVAPEVIDKNVIEVYPSPCPFGPHVGAVRQE